MRDSTSICDQLPVAIRTPIAEELPSITHFANQIEIQVGDDQRVLIARRLRDDLSARIAEITLTIEFADVPRLFMTDAIDGAHEVTVRDCMCGLFQLPQIL